MNKTFCKGHQVVASYRNSSNFGTNWISYGYGLWFLHEAQLLNKGRQIADSSCMVSGTGYLISRELIEKNSGWNFFLLTEDIEFTADCILNDVSIGYCEKARFYDEQPITFKDSWNQRVRWVKGYYQVFSKYGKQLIAKCVRFRSLKCFDMLMAYLPALILTIASVTADMGLLIAGLASGQDTSFVIRSIVRLLIQSYLGMLCLGGYTLCSEWDQIRTAPGRKLALVFTFPLFMYTYFPVALAAFGKRIQWKPIEHGKGQEPTRRIYRRRLDTFLTNS